ncbi:hypothetical protein QJS04_geneDACA001780 [Acorus gramineus]|uniref:Uncharacterized protein n=1 Tax=Acorus gramineus TaxID=55184 RepID=A0AAV9BI38_ACOGR|nr:hypothetical protein QJS04_geneDACA001780 [Acorus gramineus]
MSQIHGGVWSRIHGIYSNRGVRLGFMWGYVSDSWGGISWIHWSVCLGFRESIAKIHGRSLGLMGVSLKFIGGYVSDSWVLSQIHGGVWS